MCVAELHQDLEAAASALKHDPDRVDPEHLRWLLRRSQAALDVLAVVTEPRRARLERLEDGTWEVDLTLEVGDLPELLAELFGLALR